jgi:acyl-coenzyme A thioesterase PaaI-like protein
MQMKELSFQLGAYVPERVKQTLKLRALGFLKIPVLFFLSPSVLEINDYRCVVKIPLKRRAKNHLGSMYFGAMAAGADCAAGIMAWRMADEARVGKRVENASISFLKNLRLNS